MSNAIEDKLTKAYAASGGRNVGAFPWASIVEFILSLFGGCATPAAAQRWARRNPESFDAMIDAKLQETSAFLSATDRKAAVTAASKTFLALSRAELRKLFNDADDDDDDE